MSNPITGISTEQPKVFIRPIPSDAVLITKAYTGIQKYVEELAAMSKGAYTAPYVHYELCHGIAWLNLVFADKEETKFVGYYIIKRLPDTIHIWQAYVVSEYRNSPLTDEAYKLIEDEAKKIGYKKIVFTSPREGWEVAAKRYGFETGLTEFIKQL